MQLICPQCGGAIPASSVNVANDLAKCEACDELFKASELVADVDLQTNLSPPVGSRIIFTAPTDSSAVFEIPRTGMKLADLRLIFFATVWTGFIALWTAFAVGLVVAGGGGMVGLVPGLFSIPFWIAGCALWIAVINGIRERQLIEVTADELVIRKLRPFFSKHVTIPYDQIDTVSIKSVMPRDVFAMFRHMRSFYRSMGGMMMSFPLPCVEHGVKKTFFAEHVSDAEMKWMVKILAGLIYKLCGKKV